jgi:hypothetical protein
MNMIQKFPHYSGIIAVATMVTFLSYQNPGSIFLSCASYLGLTFWFLADLVMAAPHTDTFQRVFFLNIFIFGAWLTLAAELHTVWLILYGVKSYCVANLLLDATNFRRIR